MTGTHAAFDSTTLKDMEELFKALANPVRLGIVHELGHGPRCVHELVAAIAAPQPLISQHLRILRGARLVAAHRNGREIQYTLQDGHVAHLVDDAVRHARERNGA